MSCADRKYVSTLGLPERLFEGSLERSLAQLFITTPRYFDFIERSPSISGTLFKLVAGAKAILGTGVTTIFKTCRGDLKPGDDDSLRKEVDSKAFLDALLNFTEDKAVSTNEAGRFSLVKFGIAYALELGAQRRYTLLDLGSSAGLHLLWDSMSVRYEATPLTGDLAKKRQSDDPSITECQIRSASQISSFLESWTPPEATLTVDEKIMRLENAADLDWLSALIPVQNPLRQARLSWAIEQRRKSPLHFLQADITDHLSTAFRSLPDSLPLIIVHTFMTTGWEPRKHTAFAQQLARISVQRPFFEVSVEFDSNFASMLQVIRWSNGQRKVLLSLPCNPQGDWIEMRPFCSSPISDTCVEAEKG